MKIKIITCHDVYNAGASLQAYALQTYLIQQGYHVQIIDYKPNYLNRHYSMTWIPNPKYRNFVLALPYLAAKFPERFKARFGKRKKAFDVFRRDYLRLTSMRYFNAESLLQNCPDADAYIAGSDQIWNPLLPNGKDSAFFLQFVPPGKRRISYAASFAVSELSDEDSRRMKVWLEQFDVISVRERTGLALLDKMNLKGCQMCDPVFLLSAKQWQELLIHQNKEKYLLLYDFDSSDRNRNIAKIIAEQRKCKIYSVFSCDCADRVLSDIGPREFLSAIYGAEVVLSNSFHATAFSMIFQQEFYVVDRQEQINTRMHDLLLDVGLPDRLIKDSDSISVRPICWELVEQKIKEWKVQAEQFLSCALKD